ncbi:MAG: GAF domain-containing protein [Chloroflexota bacterium]
MLQRLKQYLPFTVVNRRAQEQRDEMALEVGRCFASALAVPELIHALAQTIGARMNCFVAVYTLQADGNTLTARAVWHPDPEAAVAIQNQIGQTPARVGEGFAGKAAATGTAQRWSNLDPETARGTLHPEHRELYSLYPARAVLAVPARSRGRVLGALSLARTEHRPFQPADEAIFQGIADRLADAMDSADLLEAERAAREQAEALRDVIAAVGDTLDTDQVMDRLLRELARVVQFESAAVVIFDDQKIETAAVMGMPEAMKQDLGRVADTETVRLLKRVGRPLIVADTRSDPLWTSLEHSGQIRSWLGVPLALGGVVIGALMLDSHEPDHFGPLAVELAEAVARQAAGAIERARFYEAMRYHAETLQMLVADRTGALADAKESLEAILSHVGDPIFVRGADGAIAQTNPRATELLDSLSPEEREALLPAIANAEHRTAADLLHLAGVHYQVVVTPIGDDDSAAVVVLHNVSRFKELDDLKSKFVSNVSNELRAPISNVKLAHSLMRRGVTPEKAAELWGVLDQETNRLERLIEDLLDLSRLELRGDKVLNVGRFHLGQVASWAVQRHADLAGQRDQTLSLEINPATPPSIMDEHQIMQVITNLILNAIRYSPAGAAIQVRVGPANSGSAVMVQVFDPGRGIPLDEQSRIFERFFRGSAALESRVPGTGLGLAICNEIVRLHNGEIGFETEPGKGTTFTVTLPVEP